MLPNRSKAAYPASMLKTLLPMSKTIPANPPPTIRVIARKENPCLLNLFSLIRFAKISATLMEAPSIPYSIEIIISFILIW